MFDVQSAQYLIDKRSFIRITNPNASSSSYCYYSNATYSYSLTILDGEYRCVVRSCFVILVDNRIKRGMHVLKTLQSKIMDGSPTILAIVAGKMAISHATPYAGKGVSIPIICKKQAEMIKKLMNISGAQILGKEELNNVMGGGDVRFRCNNGYDGLAMEKIDVPDHGMDIAVNVAETHCKDRGGVAFLYQFNP